MQLENTISESDLAFLEKSISAPRFQRYKNQSSGNPHKALILYLWNIEISRSFYLYLSFWEICLRNKINAFFIQKYGASWPKSSIFVRNLSRIDREKLDKTIRQREKNPNSKPAKTSDIVADLSVGFWVAQLSTHYKNHYSWHKYLTQIIPNGGDLDRHDFQSLCERLRKLRNRIAHHEPIFHFDLAGYHQDVRTVVGAMCAVTQRLADARCTVASVLAQRPANSIQTQ